VLIDLTRDEVALEELPQTFSIGARAVRGRAQCLRHFVAEYVIIHQEHVPVGDSTVSPAVNKEEAEARAALQSGSSDEGPARHHFAASVSEKSYGLFGPGRLPFLVRQRWREPEIATRSSRFFSVEGHQVNTSIAPARSSPTGCATPPRRYIENQARHCVPVRGDEIPLFESESRIGITWQYADENPT